MINRKGFSLLEILVVLAILSVLITFSITALTSVSRSGRDGRRKTDIEEVRTAIEQWRSDKGSYPVKITTEGTTQNNSLDMSCSSVQGLTDGANIYLNTSPKDPLCTTRRYYYTTSGQDYTLAARLETGSDPTCQALTNQCGTNSADNLACNYCVGPYGKK